jgi:hypothetical protein
MIPPAATQLMSKRTGVPVIEVKGSHAVYVSQPQAVAYLIEKAARGCPGCERRSRNACCRKIGLSGVLGFDEAKVSQIT